MHSELSWTGTVFTSANASSDWVRLFCSSPTENCRWLWKPGFINSLPFPNTSFPILDFSWQIGKLGFKRGKWGRRDSGQLCQIWGLPFKIYSFTIFSLSKWGWGGHPWMCAWLSLCGCESGKWRLGSGESGGSLQPPCVFWVHSKLVHWGKHCTIELHPWLSLLKKQCLH